jgi:outer membrane protein assembly factor BamB
MNNLWRIVLLGAAFWVCLALDWSGQAMASETRWPQFHGLRGQGVTLEEMALPVHFGPSKNVAWKTSLPTGVSSPCIWDARIFLTGYDKQKHKLETICLDRADGRIRWRQSAPTETIEKFFPPNGPATPTPASDGTGVYVYFGSYGLLAYNFDGKELWKKPLPPPGGDFGSGTSPVLAGHLLLLSCQGKSAALLAVDCRTGETVWKKDRPRFGAGYAVPLPLSNSSVPEVVLLGSRGVTAYALKDGSERWWVGGLTGGGIPTPVAGEGLLFAVAHFPGGDPDDRMTLPPFDEMVKKYDANKDGQLTLEEVGKDLVLYDRGAREPNGNITMEDMFPLIDKNQDGKITRAEWQQAITDLAKRESMLLAIRPGGQGDVAKTHVAWKEKRALPEVPSPLCYRGHLYLVKNGGIVSCFDAKTGKLAYRKRLGGPGMYYSSPVAGDGKVYVASDEGVVTVIEAGENGRLLAKNDLGEPIRATPAIVDGKLYVRTEGHLYAFDNHAP